MATPTPSEMLNTEELLALQSAQENRHYVSAMEKIFAFDEKYHTETMRNAALAPVVNTSLIISAAAAGRYANEIFNTMRKRIENLTVRR